MIDTLTKRFNVAAQSDTLASTVADLGPPTADDTVVDCPFRQVVGGVMWLAGKTKDRIPSMPQEQWSVTNTILARGTGRQQ